MGETSSCTRCGKQLPMRRLKEIVHEEGRTRIRQLVCPNCLDQIMNESSRVRGVVGTEKAAAVHIDSGPGPGQHQSMGERTPQPLT
jgi:DNA-directed RNA polymerase subunit RPC12/RpoP